MKKTLFYFYTLFIVSLSNGQNFSGNYTMNFENNSLNNHLYIPPTLNNKWEIGVPQKTVFTNAFSPTKVIVTDKINPYPTNDTSIFIIKNAADNGFTYNHTAMLSGKYFVNSDTLTDFGKIEFSPNNGTTWINLLNPGTYSTSIMWSGKPTLTGNSNGWKSFGVFVNQLGPIFNIQYGDTVLYRFSFISDGIQTNKDGLMFDDFYFLDYVESINEISNENNFQILGNPADEILTIKQSNKITPIKIELFDLNGNCIYKNENFNGQLNVKSFSDGIYFLKYSDDKSILSRKIIVRH